jgi:hypothetical protein
MSQHKLAKSPYEPLPEEKRAQEFHRSVIKNTDELVKSPSSNDKELSTSGKRTIDSRTTSISRANGNSVHTDIVPQADDEELEQILMDYAGYCIANSSVYTTKYFETKDKLDHHYAQKYKKLEVEARLQVLREIVDNPNRKSYWIELYNNELKKLAHLKTIEEKERK